MANEDSFHLGIKTLISDPEGRILLLKVNLEELSGFKGEAYWDIPGGRIKRGQSIQETLARELEEETGLVLTAPADLVGGALSNIRIPSGSSDVGLILFVYQSEWPYRPDIALSSEHTDVWWATPKEAAEALGTKYPAEFTKIIGARPCST